MAPLLLPIEATAAAHEQYLALNKAWRTCCYCDLHNCLYGFK